MRNTFRLAAASAVAASAVILGAGMASADVAATVEAELESPIDTNVAVPIEIDNTVGMPLGEVGPSKIEVKNNLWVLTEPIPTPVGVTTPGAEAGGKVELETK